MLTLDGDRIPLTTLWLAATNGTAVRLSEGASERMALSRANVERIVAEERAVYGVNTGFGKLSDVRIAKSDLAQLQLNLVRSHACGVGEPLSEPEARAMLLLRANVLAKGPSGARPVVAETLVAMLNAGVVPVVPSRGSVGASGDLAPLAHLALVAIGEGEAFFADERVSGGEALRRAGIPPIRLDAKEGLALLNGTQAMVAVGGLALAAAQELTDFADAAGAMSLEALLGTPAAFDPRLHAARPHSGQIRVAARLLEFLEGSEIRESHRENDPRVQDAYSLRCMPQVHGSVRETLEFAVRVVEIESGSATDNPLVFAETGEVISGGNFHGAPLAHAFDFAAIALTDLASISERRIDRLVNPDLNEGLPAFLSAHPGSSSGYMIAQVTAAALLNECKVLSHPASVDCVPTSGGKEDHVSMGMTSALKLRQIVENLSRVLAIEAICAAEGLEYRKPLKPGRGVQSVFAAVRNLVPRLEADRPLGAEIEALAKVLHAGIETR